jgi:hypothetical protein
MLRVIVAFSLSMSLLACSGSYAVRPVSRIAADNVGKSVRHLQDVFGEPRKVETTATRQVYVWFIPLQPKDGSPNGLHGCEIEVSVEPNSQQVLGYSLSNVGWASCSEIERRIRVASR